MYLNAAHRPYLVPGRSRRQKSGLYASRIRTYTYLETSGPRPPLVPGIVSYTSSYGTPYNNGYLKGCLQFSLGLSPSFVLELGLSPTMLPIYQLISRHSHYTPIEEVCGYIHHLDGEVFFYWLPVHQQAPGHGVWAEMFKEVMLPPGLYACRSNYPEGERINEDRIKTIDVPGTQLSLELLSKDAIVTSCVPIITRSKRVSFMGKQWTRGHFVNSSGEWPIQPLIEFSSLPWEPEWQPPQLGRVYGPRSTWESL